MHTESSVFLDSPSTTSATTYKLQWTNTYHTDARYINRSDQDTIIMIEQEQDHQ